jgi:hypothetical protein
MRPWIFLFTLPIIRMKGKFYHPYFFYGLAQYRKGSDCPTAAKNKNHPLFDF